MELEFFQSDGFIIGYYVVTVAASLALVKETKKRIVDLKKGLRSMKYAPIAYGILFAYIFFDFLKYSSST